jgi:hypothetical protein
VSVWSAVAGGFAGTLLLTTIIRAAGELGLTRMDIPFLLGTAFTADWIRARAIGYLLHFVFGLAFALVYYAIFVAIDASGWGVGAIFGFVHGLFAITALINVLLPVVHPRMGNQLTAAGGRVALLEPPGFMMLNYGGGTPIVTLAAHVVFGAVVGGFVGLGG